MAGTAAGAAKARATRAARVPEAEQVEADPPVRELDPAQKRLEAKFGSRRSTHAYLGEPSHYVVARRPLPWEGLELQVGEEVPGAAEWPRLEAWVRAGRIRAAYGERMTSANEPVEAGEPEQLDENLATAPEDEDPIALTGEPIEEGQ